MDAKLNLSSSLVWERGEVRFDTGEDQIGGWLMMGLGIFFSVVVGGGLMILIFYSSRAGYDEPPQIEYDEESD
jgi:hypothetical protein